METSRGFSSTIIFFSIIVFAVTLATSGSHDDHVNNEGGLTADDYGILKAMMDRCVEIYVDPSSPPPMNLQGDGLERLQKLNIFRCNQIFDSVRWSSSERGKFSPDLVHYLKEEIPNLLTEPSPKRGCSLDLDNNSTHSSKKLGGILSDEDNQPRVLKPKMENCVKLYLDDDDPEKQKPSDINMCHDFFWKLGYFYWCNKETFEPDHVEILKENPRLDKLNWDVSEYQGCLSLEKRGVFNCGPCFCEGVRRQRISKGVSL